jgi:hypothetical protein
VGYQVSKVNIQIKPPSEALTRIPIPSHFISLISRKHRLMTPVNVSAGSKYLTADEANGKVFFNATFLRDYTLNTPVWHLPACLFWVLLAFAF